MSVPTGVPAAGTADPAPARRIVGKVGARIMPLIGLLYVFNYMDRANIGYAQLGMATELTITAATFGVASAIFFLAYVVFEVPSNMIMKKVGARLWLSRIAVSWGIVTVLTGFVANVTHLIIARILLGIAEAGLFPGLLLYLTFWFRGRERGRAIATLALAQPIALILGSLFGGWILDHVHWFGMSSWQWVFILQGAPAVLIGIAAFRWLPDKPADAKFLSRQESAWLQAEIDREYVPEEKETFLGQLRAIRNGTVLHLAVSNLFIACGLYGLTFFLPLIVKQLDPKYSATNIGLLGAIPYLVGAVGMLVLARSSDRTGERKGHVIALVLVAALGFFGAIQFKSVPVMSLISLSLAAIGVLGYLAPYWAMAARVLSKEHTAVGLAAINSIAALGGFFGPYAIGLAATDSDVTIGLYFPIGCLIVSAIMLAFLKVPREAGTRGAVK
ncbi:MFS transporter [Amycolatopsis ultiminotia]|uniref:MFS transporter n=1 Tax=Amycolatopsis ultiminotia TaxID=543629 RepID=A0ABP6XL90_9PSEU